jgi:hypothetical protein
MSTLLFIGMLGITLLLIFSIRTDFRIYFRAGMSSRLWSAASSIIFITMIWIVYLPFMLFTNGDFCTNELCGESIYWLMIVLFVAGVFLHVEFLGIAWNKEGGLRNEVAETTSYWQRFTGDIPVLKSEKFPPPLLCKRTGLVIGISLMASGILLTTIIVMFTLSHFFMSFFIVSVAAFMVGMSLVIYSVAYLEKERNK